MGLIFLFKNMILRNIGLSKTKTYICWSSMKQRCYNSKTIAYKYYGKKGIGVCARWMKFENFLVDMGEKPEGLTLDRFDNKKWYSPENCRWATKEQQQLNKGKKQTLITFNNMTLNMSEWARKYNINEGTFYWRMLTRKLPIEKAILPIQERINRWKCNECGSCNISKIN